jgi:hypothetical protein
MIHYFVLIAENLFLHSLGSGPDYRHRHPERPNLGVKPKKLARKPTSGLWRPERDLPLKK